jgi:hypothetical protein
MLVQAPLHESYQHGALFRAILAYESHWLQPVLVFSIHCWPAPTGVGSVLASRAVHLFVVVGIMERLSLARDTLRSRESIARISNMFFLNATLFYFIFFQWNFT